MKRFILSAFLLPAFTAIGQIQATLRFNTLSDYQSQSGSEYAMDMVRASNGDYVIIGGYSELTPPTYATYNFIARFDSLMNPIWKKNFNCPVATEMFWPYKIGQNSKTGGFWVVCKESYNQNPYEYPWLCEFDSSGNFMWSKRYHTGVSNGEADVIQLTDGRFVLNAYGPSYKRATLFLDSAGNMIQAMEYDSLIAPIGKLIPGNHGDFYGIGGYGGIMEIRHMDSSGQLLWVRRYTHQMNYHIKDAIRAYDDGFLICGGLRDPNPPYAEVAAVIKFDSSGYIQWRKSYQDSASVTGMFFYDITEAPNGVITTFAHCTNYTMGMTGQMMRFDSGGNLLSSKALNDVNNGFNRFYERIHSKADGGLYFAGRGAGYSTNDWAVSIFVTDTNGVLGCPLDDYPITPILVPSEQMTILTVYPAIPFPVSVLSTPFTYGNVLYLITYHDCYHPGNGIGIEENSGGSYDFKIFPNPSDSKINLEFIESPDHVKIVSSLGQTVKIESACSTTMQLDVAEFAPGIYFVEATKDGKTSRKKFVRN